MAPARLEMSQHALSVAEARVAAGEHARLHAEMAALQDTVRLLAICSIL